MPTPRLAAFDVDLGSIHGYSEAEQKRLCYNSPEWPLQAIMNHDTILVEIASPTDTSRGSRQDKKAQAHNRRRWSLSNMFHIGRLAEIRKLFPVFPKILVSPATVWTKGHGEYRRELAAGVHGQDNHDIRACRCMLFYYFGAPNLWIPLDAYMENL